MPAHNKKTRRHFLARQELRERVESRLVLAKALAQRTRLMIARLDRQLAEAPALSQRNYIPSRD